MRLIGTFKNQKQALELSEYLERCGIQTQLDIETNTDWGSQNYGDPICNLWVIEEEYMQVAMNKMEEYLENPKEALAKAPPLKKKWISEPLKEKIKEAPAKLKEAPLKLVREKKLKQAAQQNFGTITTAILFICTILLMISVLSTPIFKQIPEGVPRNVILTPPIEKALMYDYPEAFTIMDKIIKAFGIESFQNPATMSSQEQFLINKFNQTPYWRGFYEKIVAHFSNENAPWDMSAPMFEKIRQGEFWRVLTPIFLHSDIFHLFFNMIWLIVLGKQMEEKLGPMRYILFIEITGVFSNTLQYLMSGPNFLGFSGVLCAMLMFIWMRQKRAAWEGYQLQSSTFTFIMVFIIAMFGIQLVSFFSEIFLQAAFSPGMGNTAHLSGAFAGALLGRMDFFAYQNR